MEVEAKQFKPAPGSLSRAEVDANIEALKQASADAYKKYDRAFRVLGANESECSEAFGAWKKAQHAWQEAMYQRDMSSYEFAVRLGTEGFMKKPIRSQYFDF